MVSRPVAGLGRLAAGVEEHEAAGAVGVLRHPRPRWQAWPNSAACWSPAIPATGTSPPKAPVRAVDLRPRAPAPGRLRGIDPEQVAELGVPAQPVDVEQHRPRGVRVVGDVAAGELEDEPGVDRPEGRPARRLDVLEQPLDLGAREVGVDDEPGALAHQRLVPGLASARRSAPAVRRSCQTSARWTGSPVARVPGDHRLALVGDPDRVQVGALDPGVGDRLRGHPPGHLPDLVRVVLDPAGPREVLLELRVGAPGDPRPRGRRRGRWCRSCPGRSRGSTGAEPSGSRLDSVGAREVAELAGAVQEAAEVPAGGPVRRGRARPRAAGSRRARRRSSSPVSIP